METRPSQPANSATVRRHCPVCGSVQVAEYARKAQLRLVRCRDCSMIFVDPVPSEYASGQFYDTTVAEYYLSPAKLESDYSPVRFERELRIFRRYCRSGTVLDVGCSSGAFLYQLGTRFAGCYEAVGTDASGPALEYARSRGVAVVRGDFLEQSFGGRQFDAVTLWAVLEHLAEPKAFLAHAAHLLKADGLCFVLVPNMRSLAARLLGIRYRYVYPQHLNYFTKATLRALVEDTFVVIGKASTHFNPLIIWQDWRRGGQEVSNAARAELLQRTTTYKQSPMLKPIRALYTLSEKMLGTLDLADNLVLVLRKPPGRL